MREIMNDNNKPVKKKSSFFGTVLPLLILISCVVLVGLNEFTDIKPLDHLSKFLGLNEIIQSGNSKIVSGRYECFVSEKDLGGGAMRVEQTWAYVFFDDGTYTTYLDDYQQYSGTWSQTGNALTINTPAVPNISPASTTTVTVSYDAGSFKVNGDEEAVYYRVNN